MFFICKPRVRTHRWDEFSVTMPWAGYARELHNKGHSIPEQNRCQALEEDKSISLWCGTLYGELICIQTGDAALFSNYLAKVVNSGSSEKFAANLEVLWISIGFSTLNSNIVPLASFIGVALGSSEILCTYIKDSKIQYLHLEVILSWLGVPAWITGVT